MNYHDRIVIGTSLGGLNALKQLLAQLPADFPGAVFVVQHTVSHGPGLLAGILDRICPLTVQTAGDYQAISNGQVYVAPPDRHLLVKDGYVRTVRGPKENCARPAVDPLFRSAAASYGPRVVGVVLTGRRDDGSAGLLAVKRCNGVTMVQEPGDAYCDEMPRNALTVAEPVDYQLPIAQMGSTLHALSMKPTGPPVPVPRDIQLEVKMAENIPVANDGSLGSVVTLSCPDCGGPLWQKDDYKLQQFRCHIGHAFSALALVARQREDVERKLWMTLRSLEERAALLTKMAEHAASRGEQKSAALYADIIPETNQAASEIRRLLAAER